MKKVILCLTVALLPFSAWARFTNTTPYKGFVQVRPGQKLYVEYFPAHPGKQTLFFLNGLTWSTEQWASLKKAIHALDPEVGMVFYDMEGQGQTLLAKAPINFDIPYDAQTRDLKDLFDTLAVPGPAVAVGLSYGGGLALKFLAAHPDDFQKVIAISPYLHPLPSQVMLIKQQIQVNRALFPFNPASDDELYDYFLRILVQTQYPILEPVMLENPYKTEGVFRMAKGSKTFDVATIVDQFPAGKLHLISGEEDPYVTLVEQKAFWESVPTSARGSWLTVKNTSHKVPAERPEFTAGWIYEILNSPEVANGRQFTGDPSEGVAHSGPVHLPLPKASVCESLLRRVFGSF